MDGPPALFVDFTVKVFLRVTLPGRLQMRCASPLAKSTLARDLLGLNADPNARTTGVALVGRG